MTGNSHGWIRLACLAVISLFAGPLAAHGAPLSSQFMGRQAVTLEGDWSADAALVDLKEAPEKAGTSGVLNLGNDGLWHWVRMDVPASANVGSYLEIASAQTDSIVVMAVCDETVLYRQEIQGVGHFESWNDGNYPAFPIPEGACEMVSLYLGVQSGKQLSLPLRIADRGTLRQWSFKRDVFFSFYAGIMLVMLLYNLVLYFTVQDRSYLLYVLFLVGVAGAQLFLAGYQWVLPGWNPNSWLGIRSVHLIGMFSGVSTILFVNQFLDLARRAPRYHRVFNGLMSFYLIAGGCLLVGKLNWAYQVINLVAMAALLVIPASVHVLRQGHRSARFLLIAFSFFILTVVVFATSQSFAQFGGGMLEQDWVKFAMPVGSIVEVVLLSIALADRINQLKRDSAKAREEQLRISQLNEKITREQNEVLEERVSQRTEELEERNDRLQSALEELRLAQDQLVQSEKLASIGQLTAGIAHELNNPINFVSSSAQSLRRDFDDVAEIIQSLQSWDGENEDLQEKVNALRARMTQLDLELTMKEIDELLAGIDDGANRTSEIVKGLRIFSRMDGDANTEANLNDLLESTMVILRSSLREDVALVVDLAPTLPTFLCQPGKLNQVFMNLINNAAQATVKAHDSKKDRQVRIRTRWVKAEGQECIQVSIVDNGIGMSEEVQAQIFDPFFTTKDVGEGTGLGLSIVKGILDDHKATLSIESAPGQGSHFLITFPT